MIASGGIGGGSFFALDGNHILGREESRSGHFLKRRDACKGHIISHYVQVLLGEQFPVKFVAAVGDDALGKELLESMRIAGLTTEHIEIIPDMATMFAFCFLYPDGSGGNLTVNDSVCAHVTPGQINKLEDTLSKANHPIVMAAPEVSLETRLALLKLGTKYHAFRAASFLSGEMAQVKNDKLLSDVDLLAVNLDEAAHLAGTSADGNPAEVASSAVKQLSADYPQLQLLITAGRYGSFTFDTNTLEYQKVFEAERLNTAGAGDAHFAGLLSGITAGLSLHQANQLAALISSLSVTVEDTLHEGINADSLSEFSKKQTDLLPEIKDLLK